MSSVKVQKILNKIYRVTIGKEINEPLFNKLNEEQTSWVILAAANIIVADGKVEAEEFSVLQELIQYLGSEQELAQLIDAVRSMTHTALEPLEIETAIGADVYFFLANIASVGGLMHKEEARLFPEFSKLLNLDSDYCKKIIRWAQMQSSLNQKWIKEQAELYEQRQELLDSNSARS